ncbi:hypothetical protein ABZ914_23380 [Spirillospora sp. NPDC046719]
MSDPLPVPALSPDDDYDGAAFAPIYTARVGVSGGASAGLCPYVKMTRQGAPSTIRLAP